MANSRLQRELVAVCLVSICSFPKHSIYFIEIIIDFAFIVECTLTLYAVQLPVLSVLCAGCSAFTFI